MRSVSFWVNAQQSIESLCCAVCEWVRQFKGRDAKFPRDSIWIKWCIFVMGNWNLVINDFVEMFTKTEALLSISSTNIDILLKIYICLTWDFWGFSVFFCSVVCLNNASFLCKFEQWVCDVNFFRVIFKMN